MASATLLFLILFSPNAISSRCTTPRDFEDNNPQLYTDGFAKQRRPGQPSLHRFLFGSGKEMGRGSYGEVRRVVGLPQNIVIKRITSSSSNTIDDILDEIKLLRVICGKKAVGYDPALFSCPSTAIAEYKGCVVDGGEVYIFQEGMDADLGKTFLKKKFRKLSLGRQAQFMVDLATKFQELHDKKIVHGDIKPENLMMKGDDFRTIRIVDLGCSDYEKRQKFGGSLYFLGPERFSDFTLTFRGDIYALGVTFISMLGDFSKGLDSLPERCFEIGTQNICGGSIHSVLVDSISSNSKAKLLRRALATAVSPEPKDRYKSMKDFGDEIASLAKDLPGFGSNPDVKPEGAIDKILAFMCVAKKQKKVHNHPHRILSTHASDGKGLLII